MVWPEVIKPNSICAVPITGVDLLPTLAELAGAALPDSQPVDGKSIVPLLRGDTAALTDRAIFWHYPLYLSGTSYNKVIPIHGTSRMYWRATPCSVIRRGDWKLIQFFEDDSTKLFNLRDDIGESNDLAATSPEKARELLEELQAWQASTHAVIPRKRNPDFDPTSITPERE